MARLTHVLVIDSDPTGLKTVSFGFEREGCRVTAADSTDAALASLNSGGRPDAVVLALRQGVDASRFILEDITRGQHLPLVALGAEEHRRAVTQSHADFLPIPAYLRDIITATRLRAATRADANAPGGVVQGALSEFGLFFLVRTFLALKASGVVQLERANRKGELKFQKGELRSAQIGTITGAPALNQLLLWEEAAMEIRWKPVNGRSQFNNKGSDLVEEAERFLRDFAHTARNLGSAQTVYEVVPGAEQDVQLEMAPVLRLFDGQRTVGDVLDESPFRVFDTLRIVSRFVDTETVRKKVGAEVRPAVSTSAASPLMESWLRGETEVIEPSPTPHSRGGQTGPLPTTAAAVPTAGGSFAPSAFPPAAAAFPAAQLGDGRQALAATAATPAAPAARGVGNDAAPTATRGEWVARSSAGNDKSMRQRPSMVIDLPPELLEAPAEAAARAPARPVAARAEPAPVRPTAPATAVPTTGYAAPSARPDAEPAPRPTEPRAAAAGTAVPRTTGSLEIRTAPRAAKASPRPTGTIELDPALMAELHAAQPTPLPVVVPPAAAAVPASPFAPPAAVTKAAAPPVAHTPVAASPVSVRNVAPAGGPVAAKTRTGEFDQLEKDFFAREKDLYSDGPDSFDDLE